MARRLTILGLCALASLATPAAADAEGGGTLDGSLEFLFRSLSTDGSDRKFEEDFDGLDSGVRLSSFAADWNEENGYLDHARISLFGLGDPHERASLRLERNDRFELSLSRTSQDYRYDLFELVDDEDGATWNTRRRRFDVDFKYHVNDNATVFARVDTVDRSGDSFTMRDFARNLFRFETPVDAESWRYTAGARFRIGRSSLQVEQSFRRYANTVDSSTEGDLGLEADSTELNHYDWLQRDRGGTDRTTVLFRVPVSDRVEIDANVSGTLIGNDDLESHVDLTAFGVDFAGNSFGGRCAVTNAPCGADSECDAVNPGDVCESVRGTLAPSAFVNPGESRSTLRGDLLNADVGVRIALLDPLTATLSYRTLSRDLSGNLYRDLEGPTTGEPDGVEDDVDGDGNPGTAIREDYRADTWTALLEYRPSRSYRLRGGIRGVDRELSRAGFAAGSFRNIDFESKTDTTLLAGISARPISWLRLNADYEDGDVEQPFNAVAPKEREHLRFGATLTPRDGLRVRASFLDVSSTNNAFDFRDLESACDGVDNDTDSVIDEGCWDGEQDSQTISLDLDHRPVEGVSYFLRYATQDIKSDVRIAFDEAGFATVGQGSSVFDIENRQWLAQLNVGAAGPFRGYVRLAYSESEGANRILNDGPGFTSSQVIEQEYVDGEVGVSWDVGRDLVVGGSLRSFEYDDDNDLLDYEGAIVQLRVGLKF